MATLCITGSREYAIFQACVNNDKYAGALKDMERFDENCEGMRIFASDADKKAMRRSFMFFKKAEAVIKQGGKKPDYDDPVIVERLKTVFATEISDFCYFCKVPTSNGVATKKNIIGGMIDRCAQIIKTMDARDWQHLSHEKNLIRHEPVVVENYGLVGHGGFSRDSVISQKSGNGDKSMHQILMEREYVERKKRRV